MQVIESTPFQRSFDKSTTIHDDHDDTTTSAIHVRYMCTEQTFTLKLNPSNRITTRTLMHVDTLLPHGLNITVCYHKKIAYPKPLPRDESSTAREHSLKRISRALRCPAPQVWYSVQGFGVIPDDMLLTWWQPDEDDDNDNNDDEYESTISTALNDLKEWHETRLQQRVFQERTYMEMTRLSQDYNITTKDYLALWLVRCIAGKMDRFLLHSDIVDDLKTIYHQ